MVPLSGQPKHHTAKIGMFPEIETLLLGHAVGDAIGVPVETVTREPLSVSRERMKTHPVVNMEPSTHWQLPPGCWSDDTSMVLAEMQSMIDCGRFDPLDIMRNFVSWLDNDEFTPTFESFGTGRTCTTAIHQFEEWEKLRAEKANADENDNGKTANDPAEDDPITWDTARAWALSGEKHNGNGSLMRILPVAIVCHRFDLNAQKQYELVRGMSGLTHRHPLSIMACVIHVNLLRHLLEGEDLIFAYFQCKSDDYSMFGPEIRDQYNNILGRISNIRDFNRDNIRSTGFVKDTLEAVLWCLLTTYNYREAVLRALDLGGDTDTIAALVGEAAALHYGLDTIPLEWLRDLQELPYLRLLCHQLADTTFTV